MDDKHLTEVGERAYEAVDPTFRTPRFFERIGEAAIAAAEPHIRRKVLEELIAEAGISIENANEMGNTIALERWSHTRDWLASLTR